MPFIAAFATAEAALAAEAAIAAEAALAAEAAAAASTAAAGTQTAAQAAAAAEAAQAAQAAQTAGAGAGAGAGITAAEIANLQALTGGAGTQIAAAGPAAGLETLTAAGGPGAGGAGVQTAMQSGMQVAAGPGPANVASSGIMGGPSPYSLTGPSTAPGAGPMQYQLAQPGTATSGGLRAGATGVSGIQATPSSANLMYQTPGPTGFDKFAAFADKHPFMTGAALYTGAYNLGLLDQKGSEMPQRKSYGGPQYRLSKDFEATDPDPNVYVPRYTNYAAGGVMSIEEPRDQTPAVQMESGGIPGYAKGGSMSEMLNFYTRLAEGERGRGASAPKGEDVGIYYDLDPDTRYQDALTAAQIRQAKLNKRANLRVPNKGVMRRPTPMGQINLAPPGARDQGEATEAARGGIMQASDSSLGGYASGGSPRLLRGPGDGMSDNIPAMIGRKQPARLADGEFVIPADVVSHLGNGSTEAGAKRLHEMMNNVRKARTGNPKQGKQINPSKYMPK